MSRSLSIFLTLFVSVLCAQAQTLTIREIQFTENPNGNSPYENQTVSTGGIITGVDFQGQPIRYFVADRTGGLWSGILVNDNQNRFLAIGDSVQFQAQVQESNTQTRLRNIVAGSFTLIAGAGSVPPHALPSGNVGEAVEGVLIELRDAVVTQISGTEFTVNDQSGPATVGRGWPFAYAPQIGDTLRYLRGIVSSVNNVFTLNPRNDADFGFFSNRPPLFFDVRNTPLSPNEFQSDTVTVTITDESGVAAATLYYRFGPTGEFLGRPMADDGLHGDGAAGDNRWGGVIPAGPRRATCYYYVCATDNESATGCSPGNAPSETYRYTIRSAALTIYDLQYTGNPTGGRSAYADSFVTVTGIVTGAGYGNGRDFYFSDPGGGPWSGVFVFSGSIGPALGDCVRVAGQVIEYNDLTEFTSGSSVTVLGRGTVPEPLAVRVGELADSAEAYEGCLIKIDTCVVTNTSEWPTAFPAFRITDATGSAFVTKDIGFEYVPVVGDSFSSITGCVSYYSGHGWELAPRFDADIAYIDRRPPQAVSATAVSDSTVNLLFSEALASEGLADAANYTVVDQTDFSELHVVAAAQFSTGRIVQIKILERLQESHAYRVTVGSVRDVAGNPLNGAVFSFGYEPGEYTRIADLYADFAAYNLSVVTLRGIVNFVQDVTTTSGSRRISAYIQDESGYGFSLSQTGPASDFPRIRRGNLIQITGQANIFPTTQPGSIQLGSFTNNNVTVLAENVPLPVPVTLNTGDRRLQRQIIRTSLPRMYGSGTWCEVTGTVYLVEENVGGGTNISIDDGTGNLTIRVWNSMRLDSVQLDGRWLLLRDLRGKLITIAGPSSTYGDDFQMLAGYAEDFTVPDFGPPSGDLILDVPNRPFAPDLGQRLRIRYDAPPLGAVRLRVFDLRGRLITTLVNKPAGGPNEILWDGRDDLNNLLPLGSYILHLESVRDGASNTKSKPIVVGTKL